MLSLSANLFQKLFASECTLFFKHHSSFTKLQTDAYYYYGAITGVS